MKKNKFNIDPSLEGYVCKKHINKFREKLIKYEGYKVSIIFVSSLCLLINKILKCLISMSMFPLVVISKYLKIFKQTIDCQDRGLRKIIRDNLE